MGKLTNFQWPFSSSQSVDTRDHVRKETRSAMTPWASACFLPRARAVRRRLEPKFCLGGRWGFTGFLWFIYGLLMAYLWFIYGIYMHLWLVYGLIWVDWAWLGQSGYLVMMILMQARWWFILFGFIDGANQLSFSGMYLTIWYLRMLIISPN